VTVDGWKVLLMIDAMTKIPLAVKVVPIHEHDVLSRRALGTQARANLAGAARLLTDHYEQGLLAGTELWWLDQQGIRFVVPATAHMAVTIDAQAQAAAGEGVTIGRRAHTVRHGQGRTAWTERLETEVVGITGLTTYSGFHSDVWYLYLGSLYPLRKTEIESIHLLGNRYRINLARWRMGGMQAAGISRPTLSTLWSCASGTAVTMAQGATLAS
jgi:hypothetical protein